MQLLTIGKTLFRSAFLLSFFAIGTLVLNAQLIVEDEVTAEDLAATLVGVGVEITNFDLNCAEGAYGTFIGTYSNLGVEDGIILTSGQVDNCVGPNDSGSLGTSNGFPGDPDLTAATGTESNDACIFEFDFVPFSENLSFQYVFGSEEYIEYVGSAFNDAFAFFIEGPDLPFQNIALIPGTDIPVAINNVNDDAYSEYFFYNGPGFPVDPTTTVQYDGFTTVLTAQATVTPCETYRLKLVVADGTDQIFDTGVFLKGGSLNTDYIDIDIENISVDDDDFDFAVEGCIDALVTFTSNTVLTQDVVLDLELGGSVVNGEDYFLDETSFTMLEGTQEYELLIQFTEDDIAEFNDSLVITYTQELGCDTSVTLSGTIFIQDQIPVIASASETVIEPGQFITLYASGGSGEYYWEPVFGLSDNESASPTATPVNTTTYIVYSEVGNCLLSDEVTITVVTCEEPDAGSVEAAYCNAVEINSTAVGVEFIDELDVLGYAAHNSPTGNIFESGFELYAFNSSGTFTAADGIPLNTEFYISSIVSDDDGTGLPNLEDDCIDISIGTAVFFTDAEVSAGAIDLSAEVICAGSSVEADAVGSSVPTGYVLAYALHNSATNDLEAPDFELYDINTSGTFDNGAYPTNMTLYITAFNALADGDGLPDLSTVCADVSAPAAVVFLNPVEILTNEFCDNPNEEYHVTISAVGGLPEFDDDFDYQFAGDYIGTLGLGDDVEIIFDENTTVYNFSVMDDGAGCEASIGATFVCNKLPVELLSFEGEVVESGNQLDWATASEQQVDRFLLYRSTDDGATFDLIHETPSQGDSETDQFYSYLDVAAPAGLSYYRLTQIEATGEEVFLGLVSLNRETGTAFELVQLSPVPAQDFLNVQYQAPAETTVTVNVYDISGRTILAQTVNANAGLQSMQLDLNDFAAGMYFIRLTTATEELTERFIVK